MKRFISIVLILMLLPFCSIVSCASEDQQYSPMSCTMGDVNGDAKNSYIYCEYADLNGDYSCNMRDVLSLRKIIADLNVEIADYSFVRNVGDVTNELEDLGKNNYKTSNNVNWDDSNAEKIVARNPNDMIAYKSKVYVAGGNYDTNQGPVTVSYYSREYNEGKYGGVIDSEQINRFYIYDDIVFTTSIDEKAWGSASVCFLKDYRFSFQSKSGVLSKNIHCFDMAKYNNTFFFAGSAVHYDSRYPVYYGDSLELSKGIIHMFIGDDITKCTAADFVDVPIINKNGEVISFDIDMNKYTTSSGKTYYSTAYGVPRVYDLFEWGDDLYALYYDQYMYNGYYPQENNYNGLYKFDSKTNEFVYQAHLKIDALREKFEESQDKNKILHDFQWGNKYYFITDYGLLSTSNFINYKDECISDVPNAIVRDAIFRDNSVYVLCSEINSKGSYTNYVYQTTDFINFNKMLQFDALSYVRSFEYYNGAFYFGLGATKEGSYCNPECGRIYRYKYYK